MPLTSIVDELKRLSTAEEFFATLNVSYDPKVLSVARLHILRRMGEYLRNVPLDDQPLAEQRNLCRTQLQRAYDDFVACSPLEQRVFKVLKEAVTPRGHGLVTLEDVTPVPPGTP